MDKSWMTEKNRLDERYQLGVENFLKFAYRNRDESSKIPCPCKKCNNFRDQSKELVEKHLKINGIRTSYVRWIYHGELLEDDSYDDNILEEAGEDGEDDELDGMLDDIGQANWGENWMGGGMDPNDVGSEVDAFCRLLDDAKKELYPGCENYTKLSFIITLLHMKMMCGWTIKSFDALLGIFKKALPNEAYVPTSYYEAKKIIRDLGFKYDKIDACVNDCVLYRKEYESHTICPNNKCKEPRYKPHGSKVPRKVLRYFPLKPRLRRLFIHKEVACNMRWHKEKRDNDDNIMRHPADSESWKHFDRVYEQFAQDPRSVRLGLATDGFNPFGNLSNAYSIWPVFLVPYNLPPWKCMKDPFSIMSMLIPGPKSPGNDIDVYLQPLIDELIELWHGVEAYDAHKGEKFTLRASLLWTVNDFPAYAMLSGWSTKGYSACPICLDNTSSQHLPHSKKLCYMGHRRFLPSNHRWRNDAKTFDGAVDFRGPIVPKSGHEILSELQMSNLEDSSFGKAPEQVKQRKRKRSENRLKWNKKSVFFQLPYWPDLKVRHNIDIMHVVKNVAESLIGTIMDIKGKTKDTWKSRKDLMHLGLKKDLHLRVNGDSHVMPMACYHLTKEERKKVINFLSSIKYPDGFASNISRCIKGGEFQMSNMKSHDFHIFVQRVLPLAIRGSLTKEVRQVLLELSSFFKKLCSRTSYLHVLEEEENNIAIILCKLEKMFPPSFFDVMLHLMVHLPLEAKLAGPPQFRWMFPFERKMSTLKGYVHNKARPEGCIAERYIDKECLTFCSMYLRNVETTFNRVERNNDRPSPMGELSVFSGTGRPFGGTRLGVLSSAELAKIHAFVLNNCDELEEYIYEHKQKLAEDDYENVDQRHDKQFPSWFRQRVLSASNTCHDEIRALALGPDSRVSRYTGCMVNGYRFHTQYREKDRKTQNSGVVVKGEHGNNTIDFFGVVQDIIEVEYLVGKKKVLLFKCDWWKIGDNMGMQFDEESGVRAINLSRKWYEDQPYILAYQAHQVFYLQDLKLGKSWHVVQNFNPRNSYDVPKHVDEVLSEEVYQEDEPDMMLVVDLNVDLPSLVRGTLPLQLVDSSSFQSSSSTRAVRNPIENDNAFINDNDDTDTSNSQDEDDDEDQCPTEYTDSE